MPRRRKFEADAVVIGGGLAGMVTALELLDAGKRVVILDRATRDRFGGLARWSFGGMFFVDSPEQRKNRIKDSVDLAMRGHAGLTGTLDTGAGTYSLENASGGAVHSAASSP